MSDERLNRWIPYAASYNIAGCGARTRAGPTNKKYYLAMMTDSSHPMTFQLFRTAAMFLSVTAVLHAQGPGRSYGRSAVITQQGIVATSQALASQVGVQILTRGGSAVDAAIAANAVLAGMEPDMNGVGGDLVVLNCEASTG